MYYCDKCMLLGEHSHCSRCGRSIVAAEPDDVCYFVTMAHFGATMFKQALKEQEIVSFSLPTGYSRVNGASLGEKIYEPYKFYAAATDVYNALFMPIEPKGDDSSEDDDFE